MIIWLSSPSVLMIGHGYRHNPALNTTTILSCAHIYFLIKDMVLWFRFIHLLLHSVLAH